MTLSADAYRRDPGKASALAYWKAVRNPTPVGVCVVHASADHAAPGHPQRFFKLVHHLVDIPDLPLPDGFRWISVADERWCEPIADLMADAYGGAMCVDAREVASWQTRPVHDARGWIGVVVDDERLVGAAIADLDPVVGEISLDWIQVRPPWQGCGVGRALVTEVLRRFRHDADFATVAGDLDNEHAPERLYRACGFIGDDVWHVYRA